MEISGKIIAVLPLATGQGKNGMWRSQDYVLETTDQYPKKVCFNLFNDKIDQFPMAIDDVVNVSFDVESREYNGRWYTSIRAWKIDKNAGIAVSAAPVQAVSATPFNGAPAASEGTDLPF
ncbi:MAG: DUF3127 domain-containing protein [Paludibacteraceae bacterium]|nr:DUF3127 domain-containing protein [Paludibacteraceae bacterium]